MKSDNQTMDRQIPVSEQRKRKMKRVAVSLTITVVVLGIGAWFGTQITPSKIVAELTLGFWVSLLNTDYERTLWQALRRAFPFILSQ